MKTKFLFIGLLCLSLLSCEKDNKREKDVFGKNPTNKEENEEQKEVRGFLPGVFSVSDTTKVQFSQGNLQYQASTDTWRFAENQWDYVGDESYGNVYVNGVKSNNKNISKTYDGWIDLFGWGTGDNPTKVSEKSEDYLTFKDWGDNKIINGGNVKGLWRTLTKDEWKYLFNSRTNYNKLWSIATVNGKSGVMLLPDDWTLPGGLTFIAESKDFDTNVYNDDQWTKMENAGAVFLPAAGLRDFGNNGIYVDDCGKIGYYWTSDYDASDLCITKSGCEVQLVANILVSCGESVRLCKIYE